MVMSLEWIMLIGMIGTLLTAAAFQILCDRWKDGAKHEKV